MRLTAGIVSVIAVAVSLAACGDGHYRDSEMSNIQVPRDHEGDVDKPVIE